ncbi:hypothetical protein F5X99DRAFT_425670 [Biscogniauxia marginata]|nr:hypothetical protein F5X99DRAFT_425670 [Biscogniauxia marginata]
MSRESEPELGEGNRIYGFPNRTGQDRYIQNIIDHTSNTFPDRAYERPCLKLSTDVVDEDRLFNPPNNYGNVDPGLDAFDRSLLDRARPMPSYLPTLDSRSSQRLSLPLSSRPQRVLEDASQHFRPFVPRDPDYRSPFSSNPIHIDSLEPALVSQSNLARHSSRRAGELLPVTQLETPPLYTSWNPTPPPLNSSTLTNSSPSNASRSSPTVRLSLKRQAQVASRPSATHKWSQKLQLDLDHAPRAPPFVNNTRLVDPRQALPDKFRPVFPYELFNVVQSKCFPLVYGTNDNVVISAPTSSGKTAILEMAICKLASSVGGDNFKIVYQAPTKSLCSERARDWEKKFSHMNLRCIELTGDTSQAQASRVGSASIIVTTPEKWDSVTRKWSDHRRLLEMIRLVLIDEVHFLKDIRGATLEAVVSRMKTIGANIRFIALSATVPNIEDIAKWLGRDYGTQHEPAKFVAFGEEMRPVKLQRYVYGYDGSPNGFIFDKLLDGKLTLLLAKHSEMKPIMVFCFTRKSCQRTARILAEWWSTCRPDDKAWPAPTQRVPVISQELQEIVRCGVAFHHAGLDVQDRAAVEQNFLNGQLHVICCTSTLAVGVNLPCHTVVLKGTIGYSDNGAQEYSDLEVMQMLGRAGRPQFDSSAAAIIMTRLGNVERYEKMISGTEMVESTLHQNLVEHLNSEIGLGTIQDIPTAKRWINGTFLSVRIRQNPALYNLENVQNAAGAEDVMAEWCERDVTLLQQCGLVAKQTPFSCTEYGLAMSRYMVQFETMKLLLSIPRGANLEEMLTALCKASEFREFRFKPTERALFREFNKSPFILHPIKETLTQTWHKISLIVQVHLGGVELPNEKEFGLLKADLARERTVIFDRLNRLVRCAVDCKAFDSDGIGTKVGLELARAIAASSWENKPSQLSQIPGFGPVAVRKWISQGVRTVLGVAEKSFVDIERIASRRPPYGKNLLKMLDNFPRLTMRTELLKSRNLPSQSDEAVSVMLKVNLGHCNPKNPPTWAGKIPAVTFMALTSDGNIASFWRGNMKKIDKSTGLDLKFPVALSSPGQTITCYFSCEEIVGTQLKNTLEPDIPDIAFRHTGAQPTRAHPHRFDLSDDDVEYDDVADEDMLDVLEHAVQPDQMSDHAGPLDEIEEDFPFIDNLLSQEAAPPTTEPERMDNGKWMCNHHCRNGAPTKSGKPCTHRCCHEGMDKPRPPQKKRDKEAKGVVEIDGEYPTEKMSMNTQGTQRIQDSQSSKSKPKSLVRTNANTNLEVRNGSAKRGVTDTSRSPGGLGSTLPRSKKSRLYEGSKGTATRRLKKKDRSNSSLSDIEYIDLSISSEDETKPQTLHAKATTSAQNGKQKFLDLHGQVQSNEVASERLTKSLKPAASASNRDQHDEMANGHDTNTKNFVHGDADTHDTANIFEGMSETFSDQSDLPALDEIVCPKEVPVTHSSQKTWDNDETLYPGVVDTLKESMDYRWEPDLSFTTFAELQKASERLDLPSTSNKTRETAPQSSSPAMNMTTPRIEGLSSPFLPPLFDFDIPAIEENPETTLYVSDENHPEGPAEGHESELLKNNLSQANVDIDYDIGTQLDEPAWLSEFDPEFINSLRGCVNFVD